jgi:hypothetical protein
MGALEDVRRNHAVPAFGERAESGPVAVVNEESGVGAGASGVIRGVPDGAGPLAP